MNKYKKKLSKRLCLYLCGITTIIPSLAFGDIEVNNNFVDLFQNRIKAAHFLSQATMGPKRIEIIQLANRIAQIGEDAAFNEWIDRQFAEPNVSLENHTLAMLNADGLDSFSSTSSTLDLRVIQYRDYGLWDQFVNGEDQLRQRMTWALKQIFVATSASGNLFTWNRAMFYDDVLKKNAFGNYRNLLEDITYSPTMGDYLSHLMNDKGDASQGIFPDENFAREIMQLFSIGVFRVNNSNRPQFSGGEPIENYTNEDITQLARVFTGLSHDPINSNANFFNASPEDWGDAMIMYEDHHHQGTKSFLGRTIPAGQSGDEDISDALDILFNFDTTAPFIANRLIQRFTCSTPHPHYVNRVSAKFRNNGQGVRGDLRAVIRQILMDPSARDALRITTTPVSSSRTRINVFVNTNGQSGTLQGRLKEPVLQMTQFLRFFEVDSPENETNNFDGFFKPAFLDNITQQPMADPPSVFNYYSADFLPTTGPLANRSRGGNAFAVPEFELLPTFAIPFTEGIRSLSVNGIIEQRALDSSEDAVLVGLLADSDLDENQNSFRWFVDEINIYMMYGTMETELRNDMVDALDDLADNNQSARFANAMAALLASPDYAVAN